jgi:hypothetical protein
MTQPMHHGADSSFSSTTTQLVNLCRRQLDAEKRNVDGEGSKTILCLPNADEKIRAPRIRTSVVAAVVPPR